MVAHIILRTPEPPVRGSEDDEVPTRAQHTQYLARTCQIVIQMLQQVQGSHNVEGAIAKGERTGVCLGHRLHTALSAELQGAPLQIETNRLTKRLQFEQIPPSPAS
jgi:hypothetical protein